MRNNIALLLLVFLAACYPLEDFPEKQLPEDNLDASVVVASRYLSHNANELSFEADVVLLSRYSSFGDDPFYQEEDFQLSGQGGTYVIDRFLNNQYFRSSGNSSSVILIDQSGSYAATDPHNYRSKAIHKFMEDSYPDGDFMVGGFAAGGNVTNMPTEYIADNFTTASDDQLPGLYEMAKRTGGKSNVYDAMDHAIEKLIPIQVANKDLVVLVHAQDEVSDADFESVNAKAIANGVLVHIIALGSETDEELLSSMALSTGGSFAYCKDHKTMVTVLANLQRLLNGVAQGYSIRIKVVKSTGSYQPGEAVYTTITAMDHFSEYEFNPGVVTVKIPQ